MNVKTYHIDGIITLREDKRPGGWSEIGVYVDPVLPNAGNILAAVISHPGAGTKWFVHPAGNHDRIRCSSRKLAIVTAINIALNTDAYRIHMHKPIKFEIMARFEGDPQTRIYATYEHRAGALMMLGTFRCMEEQAGRKTELWVETDRGVRIAEDF